MRRRFATCRGMLRPWRFLKSSPVRDHSRRGKLGSGAVTSAVLGETGVQYDIDKLHFAGTPDSAIHYLLLTRREAGFRNLDKLRQASGVRFGGLSVGHTIDTVGRIMVWLLGLK